MSKLSSSTASTTSELRQGWEVDAVVSGLISADNPRQLFDDLESIGHGATADIYKALDKASNRIVAIKKFKSSCKHEDDWKEIVKEINFLSTCKSDYILSYFGSYMYKHKVWIVLEYCLGSCSDILELFQAPLNEKEIAAIAWNVLQGLAYLHENKKLHRDIKSANVLLTDEATVKLADFGASSDLENADGKASTFIGSPYWMAPEVIMAMDEGTYSYPSDLWSFGITLMELAETKPPLFHMQAMSALYHIPQRDPPTLKDDTWSQSFRSFLSCCLQKEPEKRSTAKQLLEHEFVRDVSNFGHNVLTDLIERSKTAVRGQIDLSELQVDNRIVEEEEPEADPESKAAAAADEEAAGDKEADEDTATAAEPSAQEKPDKAAADALEAARKSPNLSQQRQLSPNLQRKMSKYNTIRLPSAVTREKQEELVDDNILSAQMKELRRQQKRHADALKQLTRDQQQHLATLSRKLMEQVEDLKKRHDVVESVAVREWRAETEKLKKAQELERRKQEDFVKKYVDKRRSEFKSSVKSQQAELKREQKRATKEGGDEKKLKADRKEAEAQVSTKVMGQYESEREIFLTSTMEILFAKQELLLERLKMEHLEQELQLKERHLSERVELSVEQKTGKIHELMRQQMEQTHKLNLEHQEKRHQLEKQQLQVRHEKAHVALTRRHTTQSKKLSRRLKNVSVQDEHVQEIYRRNTSGQLEHMMGTADRKLAKQLGKLEKSALQEAKSMHIKEATIKFNKQQLEEMDKLHVRQEEERQQLDTFLQQRRDNLLQAQKAELDAFDKKIDTETEAAHKYKEMEFNNFLQSKTRLLADRQAKLNEATKERQKVIQKHEQKLSKLEGWLLPQVIADAVSEERKNGMSMESLSSVGDDD